MKHYQKIMLAVLALTFVLAGSGAALHNMAEEQAMAQEEGVPGADTAWAEHPAAVPVPGAALVVHEDAATTPIVGTTGTPSPETTTTTTPAPTTTTSTAGIIMQADTTLTPTPTPPILVSNGSPLITLDYVNYAAWLTVGPNDKYIVLEVMRAKKNKDGSLNYTVANQYMYDLTELAGQVLQKTIRLDLSFLKATSTQYIQIHGDANPANVSGVVSITEQPKKPSIKYAGGVFTAKIDKQEVILNPLQLDEYEYKTLYGSKWDSLRNYNGTTSAIAGTTLLIRKKATPVTPVGVEVKLKIPAAAKAPKVAIDYVKGVISIPKGVEFKISAMGKEGNWTTYKNA